MNREDLRDLRTRLADRFGWRWSEKASTHLGLHRGLHVELSEFDGEMTLTFHGPDADLDDEILNDFQGFTHCSGGGLPPSWIQPLNPASGDPTAGSQMSGCAVTLDAGRIEELGEEGVLRIPDLMAEDFHAHGTPSSAVCTACGGEATTAALMGGTMAAPMCASCWDDLQREAPEGKLVVEQTTDWRRVLPALIVLTAVGGFVWGYLQRPEYLGALGLLLILLPAGWAFGLCFLMEKYSGGITPTLRWSLFLSILITVISGNIWGVAASLDVTHLGWWACTRIYFELLPHNLANEAPFLVGGVIGGWIALRLLKRNESVEIR